MKKLIVRIAIFFVAVAVIDIIFGMCCDYMYEQSMSGDTGKINYAIRDCKAEVLIMGSSRANHHYNPQILSDSLGMTVYNLGIDGSGVILMDGFYRLISQRYKPKYIIYELTPAFDIYQYEGDANNTRYLSQLKPYYKESCLSPIIKDVDAREKLKLYSGLYRYNTSFFNIVKSYIRGDEFDDDGYEPLKGIMGELSLNNNETDCIIDTLKIKYLYQFIKDCKEHGTELFFIVSPKYGAASSTIYKPGIQVCNEEGYEVWDYYSDTSICNKKEYFKDSYHMNGNGADLFTMKVAHRIKNVIEQKH